jgi:hypothetical protein
MLKEAFGTIEPLLALVLMGAFVLGLRWVGEMLVVPSQPQCLSYWLRDKLKTCARHGCSVCNRGQALVKMGAHGVKKLQPHRLIALFDQAEKAQPC